MRFAAFFLVILVVLAALGLYVHRRASGLLGLGQRGRRVLAGVLAAGAVAMIAARMGRGALPDGVLRGLGITGSVVSLSIVISAVLLAVVDLGRLLAWSGRAALARAGAGGRAADGGTRAADGAREEPGAPGPALAPREPAPMPPALPRRAFLAHGAAGSAFLIGSGSSIYGALLGRHDYVIEEIAIPIPGLPRSLDGFSIVQLSDIHLGLFVGEPEMRAAEDLVRKARADLIVMTGDLIDHDPRYAEHLGRLTRRLGPLAREGVAAIPGNHDHFAGIGQALDALQRGGAHVLRNRGRVVGDAGGAFALLGVDDVWAARMRLPGGGPDLARAIADVPRDLPRVLLCHNPVFFPEAAGEVALQLSGHTHGGQVNLVVRPADLVLPYGYVAGLYQRGGSHLYINRGFGTAGPPARIGAPPEVSRIVLVAA
ncbi:metallophosphatase [Sorangium cellulosum]|uniref:Metallophosphatase n=1 Tax=Sorangium cellulosum TaxID=56 RepID=A0A2L0F9W9_SORCE|nr:metallophosphoesterase [Sorangium cellulosum]AUX48311.1 metallophosphatase [Sorangium cellulosum]